MGKTSISWTNETWNPVTGCSVVSPGCTNCYAMHLAGTRLADSPRYEGLVQPTKSGHVWTGEVRLIEKALLEPLRWKRPRMIFVNSMSDVFHEKVPLDWLDAIFAVMVLSPQHTFQILTKRSQTMRWYLGYENRFADIALKMDQINPGSGHTIRWPLPNVWVGVSTEDQKRANERIPDLLAVPAAIRFISAEPLLGHLSLTTIQESPERQIDALRPNVAWDWVDGGYRGSNGGHPALDWVIVGGESGQDARPMHPEWARIVRDQCITAGVAFHFKQWGEWVSVSEVEGRGRHYSFPDGATVRRVGKSRSGNCLDGMTHEDFPTPRPSGAL